MNPTRTCPDCGSVLPDNAPKGLCPKCLVALASEPLPEPSEAGPIRYFGDYELLSEIARGGMGVVWRARQRSLNRIVALKMIGAGQLAGATVVQRFRTEAEAAANLDHPNIVPIYEIGELDGHHFFSMKLIDGENLACELAGRPMDSKRAARIVATVAHAVHHAHQRGVLHRDLKPANILLDDEDEPHLTDFGLAKLIQSDTVLTRTMAVLGTFAYMPPEQAAGKNRLITIRSDIYSLGAIFYELLTGQPPFPGDDPVQILREVIESDPPSPRLRNPHVDLDLETICLKCLEKSPARRYASALDVANDLERSLRHEPILARPSGLLERMGKWIQRRPLRAALVGVICAATVLTALLLVYAFRQSQQARFASHKVVETVSRMEAQEVQDLFETENPAAALAHLSRVLRDDLSNSAVAARLMAALMQRRFPLLLAELKHDAAVHGADFSPDGQRVVTFSDDRTARLWDTRTGRLLRTFSGHQEAVLFAQFSPNGERIVTACKDRFARVWDARNGELIAKLEHSWWVRTARFSPDGRRVLTACTNQVLVWEVASASVRTQQVSGTHARFAQFSGDGQRIAAASQDGAVFVWNVRSGELVARLTQHERAARMAQFSPDHQRLVTASDDGTARVWELPSGRLLAGPLRHDGPVVSACFHPAGEWIVTASEDGTARLWDARTGEMLGEPLRHRGQVRAASFSPDGLHVLTAADDATSRLWDAATGKPWGEAIKHGDFVESASFSPDGQQVVTVSSDNAARLWRFPAVQPVVTSLPLADGSGKLEFSPDGQSALTISNDFIIVWNLPTGQLVAPPRREAGVEFAQLSADGQFVAAACRDMTVRVWKRGESAERILHHADTITRIEFSADGRRLVTAVGKRVLVWNAESAEPIAGPWVHEEAVQSVRFSADGMRVVSASGNFARVWPLQTGQPEVRSFPHEARVESAMFSPDGRSVATASGVTVRVWDAQTGRILATLHHRKQVNSVSFSPDGTRLVTAAADQTLRVWSAVTGQPLTDPISIEVPVWGAQFTSCGRWIIAKTDLSALMWEMPLAPAPAPAWLAELGEAVAGQRLNDSQVSSPVPTETVLQLRERLATSSKTNSYAIWARWFFADARERAASPAAHLAAKKEDR